MKYKKLTGIILKKQNYKEADQIVTVWTKELGKVRVLARSLRLSKSKLAYNFQDLSLVELEITGSKNLPTLINTKTVKSFKGIKEMLPKIAQALYACELMLKMTGDEHRNQLAFDLMIKFLSNLETSALNDSFSLLDKFSLDLAKTLGFGQPKKIQSHSDIRNFIESILERNLKSEAFLTYV